MNLVQLQERLKDAPTQAVMQYANGGNPMVPPYLALAELQRRESVSKSAANQQAMAQGKQPSVKEQVEQAAGLAALQKQMQAQGLQSLMGAGVSVPSVPSPERQPEAEGVATLPTDEMYNFAEGGIIGYAGGDLVRGDSDWMSESLQAPVQDSVSRKPTREEINRIVEALQSKGERISLSTIKDIEAGRIKLSDVQPPPIAAPQSPAQLAPPPARKLDQIPPPGGELKMPEVGRGRMPMGAPEGAAEIAPQAMPRTGIAALPGAEDAARIYTSLMKQPKPEESIATEREFAKAYGTDQPYGDERMKRIQEMQAERQQMLEPRGTERLMRVLGGIAGRGLQGAGPAYLQAIEGERASDIAFRRQMDELMASTEEKRRADLAAGAERARKDFDRSRELQVRAAGDVFSAQQQRELKQAEMEFRRLEMKANQQQRLTPREQFLVNYAGGDFDKYLEGVRKIAESEQGPKSDMASERSLTALFNKYNENPMLKSQYKTFEEYLKAYRAATGETAQATNPIRTEADAIIRGGK